MKIITKLPQNINKYDYLFIGSGLSTATVCATLPADKKILVIEKRPHIAGNVFDYNEKGILVHKYGPHIFHTNDEEVFTFLNKFTKFNSYKNVVEAKIDDNLIPLPININSIKILFPNEAEEFINYLKSQFPNQEKITILELSKLDKFQHIYQTIYNRVFASYTSKMWNKSIEELDASVFARVPIYLSERNTYFTDKFEGLPVEGYTKMVENMMSSDNIEIIFNTNISEVINFQNNSIYIENSKIDIPIINCAPIDEIFGYKFGKLTYRSLNIQFETLDVKTLQKTAVVNYPEHISMTRITEYKNFYPEKNIDIDQTIISKEYPGDFDENSQLFSERYYPIPNDISKDQYSKYLLEAQNYPNLYHLGRLAKYEYVNMDQIVRKALDFAEKLSNK